MSLILPEARQPRRLPRYVWWLLLTSSAALLAYSILRAVWVPMTFDEIWSLNSYASASWSDILTCRPATANNHIGNSLLMKLCLGAFGNSPLSLRLPNLVAHAVFLLYSIQLARRFRQGIWVLLAFFLLNFHPFMLDFFSLARGYGLSMAMVMAALYHLFAFRENPFTRHNIWNMVYASLAVAFNFSFLHFFMANAVVLSLLLVSHARTWEASWKVVLRMAAARTAPLLVAVLSLYLFMRVPVKALIEAKELYYGGQSGFWSNTVYSLAHSVLYKIDFWRHDVDALLTFCLLTLLAMFIVFAVELSEQENKLHTSPGMLALLLMVLPAVTCTLQHYELQSPFLIYRTALFMLPIYMLGLAWLLRTLTKIPITRPFVVAISILLTLALGVLNGRALNFTHSAEWISDADTPQALEAIVADRAALGKKGPFTIGLSWQLRPVANYYRVAMGLTEVPEILNNGCQPGMDYYLVLGEGSGCKLPADQLPFGEKQGATKLQSYPTSGATLWRGTSK